jgi:cytochrome c biogenesis protein
VNHPASYKGVEIYQSSFDDGGSRVKLSALPMKAATKPFEIEGVIGGSSQLTNGNEKLTLEYTGLRVINVENFSANTVGGSGSASGVDVRKVDLRESLNARMGAANKVKVNKDLRNVGPSITYKLRDAAGQAREFHNYMLPVDMGDGAPVFLMGLRDTPSEPFRYLRVPADEQGSPQVFFKLREALADPAVREQAIARYVANAVAADRPDLRDPLAVSASRALALFAGATSAPNANAAGQVSGGLQAMADFMETNVPEAERTKAGDVLVRILNGTLFEMTQMVRAQAGLKPLLPNEATQAFMSQAVLALSDAQAYPAPMVLQLADFTQVQASVFQVARAPGKSIVYLGCALLILGVFAMLYIRERRLWVWLTPHDGRTNATMALSSNRKTLDGDHEFEQLKTRLLGTKDH